MTQGRSRFEKVPRSLFHNDAANTLAMVAAALVPLLAMVGGGVDASLYYMTASRMQAACDAGALAARRAMPATTMAPEHRDTGLAFFDQNFPDNMFGVTGRTRNYTATSAGVVNGTASANLPTVIMQVFGFDSLNVSVSCSADINISNTDIVFVLDVTGSMSQCPNGTECNSNSNSKIVGLRNAVIGFYDTVAASTSPSAQVRYGVVPYSQQVRVGHLIPDQYMASDHTYQSRVARFQDVFRTVPGNGVKVGDWIEYSRRFEDVPRDRNNFGSTTNEHYRFRNRNNDPNRQQDAAVNTCTGIGNTTRNVGSEQWEILNDEVYGLNRWTAADGADVNWRAGCKATVIKRRRATEADVIPDRQERTGVTFRDWVYCPVDTSDPTPCDVSNAPDAPPGWDSVDLATLYDDNQIMLPTGPNGTMVNHVWEGCIEEPSTVRQATYNPIPADAHDLNINLVPANDSQRWKPALRDVVWVRDDSNGWTLNWRFHTGDEIRPDWRCPAEAFRLREIGPTKAWTKANLVSYVDSLVPTGNTYHDIGMVWGARFISPKGIFAADNRTAPNGDEISRHIVFMTDGQLFTEVDNYTTHGVEWWDRRVTDDGVRDREMERRAERLLAVCRAAQAENITVWVVAFGTTLTSNLRNCASPGRAYQASSTSQLNTAFQEIAQKIAALRLTS